VDGKKRTIIISSARIGGGWALAKARSENDWGRRASLTGYLVARLDLMGVGAARGCTLSQLTRSNKEEGGRWTQDTQISVAGARTPPRAHWRPNLSCLCNVYMIGNSRVYNQYTGGDLYPARTHVAAPLQPALHERLPRAHDQLAQSTRTTRAAPNWSTRSPRPNSLIRSHTHAHTRLATTLLSN
jgi:hypothetical protein